MMWILTIGLGIIGTICAWLSGWFLKTRSLNLALLRTPLELSPRQERFYRTAGFVCVLLAITCLPLFQVRIARWIFQAELLPPWLAIVSGMSATITYIAIMSLGRYAAEHRANEALRTLTTARFHHMML